MMDLKLNFLGVNVADFEAAFRFYTQVLGIEATDRREEWAYMGTSGMTWELFGVGDLLDAGKGWGSGQAIRPGLQIESLEQTAAELRERGVSFAGDIRSMRRGKQIVFLDAEDRAWTLTETADYPRAETVPNPHLGWVELKAHDLPGQEQFYREVMGLQTAEENDSQILLVQEPGEPLLILEGGGLKPARAERPEQVPFFISFETADIERAADWIRSQRVMILADVTEQDWGGIDLIVADADGNPVQVVEYVSSS